MGTFPCEARCSVTAQTDTVGVAFACRAPSPRRPVSLTVIYSTQSSPALAEALICLVKDTHYKYFNFEHQISASAQIITCYKLVVVRGAPVSDHKARQQASTTGVPRRQASPLINAGFVSNAARGRRGL
ncbi:hypothetical protein EVAR_21885_1 [Eumeta japonica]|uniref:Uncharacterized protein n=1 Tax=Eumeta variegata TaxID=151549 RepID=A0A4C1V7Z7_EUMVA|nr:hypothetical protein EVAR_21885_1 [Eumeta japonica]